MYKQKIKTFFIIFEIVISLSLLQFIIMSCLVQTYADDISAEDQNNNIIGDAETWYPMINQVSGRYYDIFNIMHERVMSIASKMEETSSTAPSIISVITAKEIEDMGIRTLGFLYL